MAGSFRAQNFQKSKKFHQLQRKWFHFKPLTPTHQERQFYGIRGGGGRSKVGVRKLERRKVEGGRRGGGVKEEGRQEGGLR